MYGLRTLYLHLVLNAQKVVDTDIHLYEKNVQADFLKFIDGSSICEYSKHPLGS